MKIKELSRKDLEDLIADKGIGSGYLKRAERIQRDVNLAILLGSAAILLCATALTIYKFKGE